jgi:hypothetical protein
MQDFTKGKILFIRTGAEPWIGQLGTPIQATL